MSSNDQVEAIWHMPELADPTDPWSEQIKCAMCLEPGRVVDGEFVHDFSGKAKCTYKSHL